MTGKDLQRVYEATAEELRKWQQKCLDMAKRIDALEDPNYAKTAKDAATLGVGFVRFNEDGGTSLLDPSAVFLAPPKAEGSPEKHVVSYSKDLLKEVIGDVSTFRDMEPEEDESWESWYYAAFDMLSSRIRETFERNRSALSASPAGVVKPLNWVLEDLGLWKAQTNLIACYSVWDCGDHWECSLLDGQFPSAEAAKSAAFADYSARIMSAIEQDGVGVETAGDDVFNDEALTKQVADFLLERDQQTSQDERDEGERESSAFFIAQMVRRHVSAALKGDEQ